MSQPTVYSILAWQMSVTPFLQQRLGLHLGRPSSLGQEELWERTDYKTFPLGLWPGQAGLSAQHDCGFCSLWRLPVCSQGLKTGNSVIHINDIFLMVIFCALKGHKSQNYAGKQDPSRSSFHVNNSSMWVLGHFFFTPTQPVTCRRKQFGCWEHCFSCLS